MSLQEERLASLEKFTPWALCGVSFWILIVLLRQASIGFDFTDEGYYLNWIADPFSFHQSITHYGYVYHSLYRLVGGDIVALRQTNLLLTYSLAWWCALLAWRTVSRTPPSTYDYAICGVLALPALLLYARINATPSYNSLCLQGMLIALIGALMAEKTGSWRSCVGWMLLTLGVWLTFLAKPPSAAALGLILLSYLIASRKISWINLFLSVALGALCAAETAFLIDGSIAQFIARLQQGVANAQRMQGGHDAANMFRWDWLETSPLWGCVVLLVATGGLLAYLAQRPTRSTRLINIAISSITALYAIFMQGWWWTPAWDFKDSRAVYFLAFPSGFALTAMYCGWRATTLNAQHVSVAVMLTALMYCFAFGSNVNYIQQMGTSVFFGTLASATLSTAALRTGAPWREIIVLLGAIVASSSTIFYANAHAPYRQPVSMYRQTGTIETLAHGNNLTVGIEMANYLKRLNEKARQSGFKPGTPMLDLTGHHPGVIHLLGGRPVGAAWLLGGYKGSVARAEAILSTASCGSLARAWILLEPTGHRAIPVEILEKSGISPAREYVEVVRLKSVNTYYNARFEQVLLKPSSTSHAEATCKAYRQEPR